MTNEERRDIAKDIIENMKMTKEQYKEFCKLADKLDLELVPDIYFD